MKKYIATVIALVAVLVPSAYAVNSANNASNVTINQLNRRVQALERFRTQATRQINAVTALGACLSSTQPIPMVLRGNRNGPEGYAYVVGQDLFYATAFDSPVQGETPGIVPTINPSCLTSAAAFKFQKPAQPRVWPRVAIQP